jgi:hypothetical protein
MTISLSFSRQTLSKLLSSVAYRMGLESLSFVDAAMSMAAAGYGDQVSKLLQEDELGATMEPLIVALRIKRGDTPIVAKEVMEVAIDIAAGGPTSKRAGPKPVASGKP